MSRQDETLQESAVYWGYRAFERLALSLPERRGRRVFEALGRASFRWLPNLRRTVAANQARVLGADPSDERVELATREAFALYARYWFDTFRLWTMPDEEFNARCTIHGLEHVDRALEDGRGCLAVLPEIRRGDVDRGHGRRRCGLGLAVPGRRGCCRRLALAAAAAARAAPSPFLRLRLGSGLLVGGRLFRRRLLHLGGGLFLLG